MRIEQLEYVATVARLGSFRRAADELHISQPALSGSVRSLERELGVDLLDRGRHGARMSDSGRELFPYILTLLDSFDRLRHAAGEQHRSVRLVRLGTVSAATAPLLAPTIQQFRQSHPLTQVEVIGAQQVEIHRGVLEGSFDLGLVNYLDGDDMPPELETTRLLRGRPVVVLPADSPLAQQATVHTADLLAEPLIVMRSGYVMHRYLHRLLQGQPPAFSYSTDGAEMGKLMVAEGLGLTVLPDFSVIGDPLEQHGVITWRPLADDHTGVDLVIQRVPVRLTPAGRAGSVRHLRRAGPGLHRRPPGERLSARTGTIQETDHAGGRPAFAHDLRPAADGGRALTADAQRGGRRGQPDCLRHRPAPEDLGGQRGGEAVARAGRVDQDAHRVRGVLPRTRSRVRTWHPRRPRVTTPRPPWRGTAARSSLT